MLSPSVTILVGALVDGVQEPNVMPTDHVLFYQFHPV